MPNFAITAGALPYHADYREKEQEGTSDKATANGQSERGGRLGVSQFAGRVEHLGADRIEAQRAVVDEEVAKAELGNAARFGRLPAGDAISAAMIFSTMK